MTPEAMNTAQAIGVDDIINEQRVLNTHPKITKESTRRELQVLGILDEDQWWEICLHRGP